MKKLLKSRYFGTWLLIIIAITLAHILVYATAKQLYRQNGNDPQIRTAQEISSTISKGVSPIDFDSQEKIELSKSLSTFIMVYDINGDLQASTAQLNNTVPTIPIEILELSEKSNEIRLIWRPQKDLRIALVIIPYNSNNGDGFIAVGRSLKEIDDRICNMAYSVFNIWLASIIIITCATYILEKSSATKNKKS